MKSVNSLDKTIAEIYGRSEPGDIGLELELEGQLAHTASFWSLKEEGSLRGGGEYVLKRPTQLESLPEVLKHLKTALKSSAPVVSIRCSTHVHINVCRYTARQVYQIALMYYLLEPVLLRTQPAKRFGNLFCLAMEQAEAVYFDLLVDITRRGKPFSSFTRESNRYAALNLVSVHKFGSVEFRFLDAITDVDHIALWSKMFLNLTKAGAKTSVKDLFRVFDDLTPLEFVEYVLGAEGAAFIRSKFPEQQTLNALMCTNYDYVHELAHRLGRAKFSLPKHMWRDDISEDIEDAFVVGSVPHGLDGAHATLTQWHQTVVNNPFAFAEQQAASPPPPQTEPFGWGPAPVADDIEPDED
jgi:hypothetical protein